jgi:glycosyltransferase involved in cell wall biosynthesis
MSKATPKIRILYYGSSLSEQKGANLSIFRLAKTFNREKTRAIAVLPGYGGIAGRYDSHGLEYRVIPSMLIRNTRSLRYQLKYITTTFLEILRLRKLIKKERIQIVHVNDITFFQALIAAKIDGVPAVCHVRFTAVTNPLVKGFLLFMVTRLSDVIVCVSAAVKQQLFNNRDRMGRARIYVIHNPSPDAIDFVPAVREDPLRLKTALGIPSGAFAGCLISKFTHNKGQHVLARAAKILKDSGYTGAHFQFLLVGGMLENHSKYYHQVHQYIKDENLEDMVKSLGVRDDVARILSISDFAIHVPVHEDPFPGVVLEAMLSGKPIIASASGGIPEMIDDSQNGFLIPKNDPHALAEKIKALYHDPSLLEMVGRKAAASVRERFPFSKFYESLLNLYTSLVKIEHRHAACAKSAMEHDESLI